MKAVRTSILAALAMLALATGCQYRELDYTYTDAAEVTVIFNWEDSELSKPDINGRTVCFYPVDGSEPIIKISHLDTVTVNLKVGEYRCAFMNETFSDFDNIYFEGTDSYDDIEAILKKEADIRTGLDRKVSYEPDGFAVVTIPSYIVTEEMVDNQYFQKKAKARNRTKIKSKTKGVTKVTEDPLVIMAFPDSKVYKVEVVANVNGLDRIASAGTYITGFADNYDFSEGLPGGDVAIHMMTFTGIEFNEGSSSDGKMKGSFKCFGLRYGATTSLSGYKLTLRAVLVNGAIFEETRDINDCISEVAKDGTLKIYITLGEFLGGAGDKPYEIPEVPHTGGSDGWEITVGDWQTEIIPIDF